MTRVRLYDNTFFGNGPVYAMAENLYSVYQKFFSGRTMSFTDPDCSDELHFLQFAAIKRMPTSLEVVN